MHRMPLRFRLTACAITLGCLIHLPIAAQSTAVPGPADLPGILARVGDYVARFEAAFSYVVSEERYAQDIIPTSRRDVATHREMVSDFLLVRLSGSEGWVPFRDVFEVDGAPVRDHQDRLMKLFVAPSDASPWQRAAEITEQSARYNIGIIRTVNQPLLALQAVRESQQRRFSFSIGKTDATFGPDVVTLEYREETRPSVIRGPSDRDMPMHGRIWIDGATGQIRRSEIVIDDAAATITTSFGYDPASRMMIPAQMQEQYRQPNGTRIIAVAKYGRFRTFRVDVNYGRGGFSLESGFLSAFLTVPPVPARR